MSLVLLDLSGTRRGGAHRDVDSFVTVAEDFIDHARIVGTRCHVRGLTYVPATMFCERCFSELDDWVEVPSRGRVFTYTMLYRDLDDEVLAQPAVLAYVKLDDCDGGLVHHLGEVEPEEVLIGLEVEAVFKDAAERKGSILDIQYFRPVDG
ncbi:MAG: Zn-ribbon domain-containing OB-fold protein [Anaerolineae bacterium]|nr:Zn-ribbon domain-containing OB-fold protein [Anaerolineae bacterium]